MRPQPNDPNWPRASSWLAGESATHTRGTLAIVGIPIREGSITPGRCDLAPRAFREALAKYSTYDLQSGHDLRDLTVRDYGDLNVEACSPGDAAPMVGQKIRECIASSDALVVLGGNNSVTRPALLGMRESPSRCGLLTLDAHLDLRDLDGGLTNGNPIRALLQDGLPGPQIVQIGIQPFVNSMVYARIAQDAGITVIPVDQVRARGIKTVVEEALCKLSATSESIYVDLDLDVLDRAFAPATPGSRPGGLSPWELETAARVCGLHGKVRVVDLVEVDPTQDVANATVLTGALCLLSFAAGLWDRMR